MNYQSLVYGFVRVKNLIFPILLVIGLNTQATEITIAGDNWCPINCVEGSEQEGFMIDVAKEALALSGYKVNYIEIPWTRAVGLARKGEVQAVVGAFRGDAPDFVFPQNPLLKISPSALFVTKDDWQYSGISSMNKVTLGAIKGYDYGGELNAYINSLLATDSENIVQLYGNNAVQRNIQFLLKDRIDVFVESAPVLWYQAKLMGVENKLKQIGEVSPAEPCFIAFSPSLELSAETSKALDSGIETLKKSGRIAEIAKTYGLPPSSYQ